MSARELRTRVAAVETSDGAGVRLRRAFGGLPGLNLDPFLLMYEGELRVGSVGEPMTAHHLGVLTEGDSLRLEAGGDGGRALLLAGRPLREPVARYGPFVTNTSDQIRQAVEYYQHGRLTGSRS